MIPPDNYMKPDWFKAGRVHDWRNHVSDSVRALWPTFTDINFTFTTDVEAEDLWPRGYYWKIKEGEKFSGFEFAAERCIRFTWLWFCFELRCFR